MTRRAVIFFKTSPMTLKTLIMMALTVAMAAGIYACMAGEKTAAAPGNPLVPGYFADPSICRFGDHYYLYATTDGVKLASGEPTVWVSQDLENWYNFKLDLAIPEGLTNVWAPDVFQGKDGRFYYMMGNCQRGCHIYGYVSPTPTGPWEALNEGRPVIEAGTGADHLPALDAQYFTDEDGRLFSYFGTWCHLFGGIGWVEIDPADGVTILQSGLIPMEQVPHAFEAPYMVKRQRKYFLMYSSGDCRLSSYAVHYSVGDSPTGPFVYGGTSPILASDNERNIDSPGHHSVLNLGNSDYIFYHRHNYPHSTGGMFRQVCADALVFEGDSVIQPVRPSHTGPGFGLGTESERGREGAAVVPPNLAAGASATASSSYQLRAPVNIFTRSETDHLYAPSHAVDGNNGTLWKAANQQFPQSLVVDMGAERRVQRVMLDFEYSVFYYQYLIETSRDGQTWTLFADRRDNRVPGSPMVDDNAATARYVRVTVTGAEKQGLMAALWNVRVYEQRFEMPDLVNKPSQNPPAVAANEELLVHLSVADCAEGVLDTTLHNMGSLKGRFLVKGFPLVEQVDGRKGLKMDGHSYLELDRKAPPSLDWNGAYTVSARVFHPAPAKGEGIITWTSRANMLQGSFAALMYGTGGFGAAAFGDAFVDMAYDSMPEPDRWHLITLTFDGMKAVLYVDGRPVKELPLSLFVAGDKILIGTSGIQTEHFTSYLDDVRLYDRCLNEEEVARLANTF